MGDVLRFDAENFTCVATIEVTLSDRTVVQARGPSNMLLDEHVFVTGFGYPVVPQGQARVRCQLSAAHTKADIDEALAAFKTVGKKLGII